MSQTSTAPNMDVMSALAQTVTRARTLEELVRPLLETLQAVTGLESTYLTTIDEDRGVQHVLFARNTRHMQVPEGLNVPWEGTLCKRALDEGQFYASDVSARWGDCVAARELGIETYASTPVRMEGGELYGTLCAASSERHPLTDNTSDVLKLFAGLIGQQVEREQLVQALSEANSTLAASALTDTVTRLPNRRALMEAMEQRLSSYRAEDFALVVAFIDLDRFKAINDHYGHDIGDRFLEAIGGRLQGVLRDSDMAARLGGDEFVVIATTQRGAADASAESLRARLFQATSGRFKLDHVVLDYGGPSIGMVVSKISDRDAQSLLAQADEQMYAVKRERHEGGSSRASEAVTH